MKRLAKMAAISALVGAAGLPFQSANGFWGGGPWDGYGWGGWGGPWGNPYYGGGWGGPWGYGYPYGGWGAPGWGGYGGYPLVAAPLVLRPVVPAAAPAAEEPKEEKKETPQESETGATQ